MDIAEALAELQHPSSAERRQAAEGVVGRLGESDIIALIVSDEASLPQKLLLSSVLSQKAPESPDVALALLAYLYEVPLGPQTTSFVGKIAQILSMSMAHKQATFDAMAESLFASFERHVYATAKVFEEFFCQIHRYIRPDMVKLASAIATRIFGCLASSPRLGQVFADGAAPSASPVLVLALFSLMAAAAEYIPNELPLFAFLATDPFLAYTLQPTHAPAVLRALEYVCTNKLPKSDQACTGFCAQVLRYLNAHAAAYASVSDYAYHRALVGAYTSIYLAQAHHFKKDEGLVVECVGTFLHQFSLHPSHMLFGAFLPCYISIFNDHLLRGYKVAPLVVQSLYDRVLFFVCKTPVRALLTVDVGRAAPAATPAAPPAAGSPSLEYLLEDGYAGDVTYWVTWFGSFKSKCLTLLAKLASVYPNLLLSLVYQGTRQILEALGRYEVSMREHMGRDPSPVPAQRARCLPHMQSDEYYALDAAASALEAVVASVLQQTRYEGSFAGLLDTEGLTALAALVCGAASDIPIFHYRLLNAMLAFYKEALSVPVPAPGPARPDAPAPAGAALVRLVSGYLGPLFQKLVLTITYRSAVLRETECTGARLYAMLTPDTLAVRKLAATRLSRLSACGALLNHAIFTDPQRAQEVLRVAQAMAQAEMLTEYEALLLNQVVANVLLAQGDRQTFDRHLASVLSHTCALFRSPAFLAALASVDAFAGHFLLQDLRRGVFAAGSTSPEAIAPRRQLMLSLLEAEAILGRIHEVHGMHETVAEFLPLVGQLLTMLVSACACPPGAAPGEVPGEARGDGRPNLVAALPYTHLEALTGMKTVAQFITCTAATASGSVMQVNPETPANAVTDMEYVHSWLEKCLGCCLSILALDPGRVADLCLGFDFARIPVHVTHTLLRALPRLPTLATLELLRRVSVGLQSSIAASFSNLLPHEIDFVARHFAGCAAGAPVIARIQDSVYGTTLSEDAKEIVATNLLALCDKQVIDIFGALFAPRATAAAGTCAGAGTGTGLLDACLSSNDFFVSVLTVLRDFLITFATGVKFADRLGGILDRLLDAALGVSGAQGAPFPFSLSPVADLLILMACHLIQFRQHDSSVSMFATVIGKAVQLLLQERREDLVHAALGPFFASPDGHVSLAYLQTSLRGANPGDAKSIRNTVRTAFVYVKRLDPPEVTGAANININALFGRSTADDSLEVNLGDYPIFDE